MLLSVSGTIKKTSWQEHSHSSYIDMMWKNQSRKYDEDEAYQCEPSQIMKIRITLNSEAMLVERVYIPMTVSMHLPISYSLTAFSHLPA